MRRWQSSPSRSTRLRAAIGWLRQYGTSAQLLGWIADCWRFQIATERNIAWGVYQSRNAGGYRADQIDLVGEGRSCEHLLVAKIFLARGRWTIGRFGGHDNSITLANAGAISHLVSGRIVAWHAQLTFRHIDGSNSLGTGRLDSIGIRAGLALCIVGCGLEVRQATSCARIHLAATAGGVVVHGHWVGATQHAGQRCVAGAIGHILRLVEVPAVA